MSKYRDKLRKARESIVEAGGWKFTIRRPTDMEVVELHTNGGMTLRNTLPFVVGWNLTELDLGVPGGSNDPADFDAEDFAYWIEDQPGLWGDLMQAIQSAYQAHADKREASAKN